MSYIYLVLFRAALLGTCFVNSNAQDRVTTLGRAGLISMGGRAELMAEVAQVMGDRLQVLGKERILLSGTLTRGTESRPIEIAWQLPGKFRITDGLGTVASYGGAGDLIIAQSRKDDGPGLVQALVGDQIESILHSIATSGGIRFLGARFRTDDGKAAIYSGPYLNHYMQVLPRGATGNVRASTVTRLIAFDSDSLYLRSVRTTGTAGAQATETRMLDWKKSNGQAYPTEIVFLEGDKEVFRFRTTQIQVGERFADTVFAGAAQ